MNLEDLVKQSMIAKELIMKTIIDENTTLWNVLSNLSNLKNAHSKNYDH